MTNWKNICLWNMLRSNRHTFTRFLLKHIIFILNKSLKVQNSFFQLLFYMIFNLKTFECDCFHTGYMCQLYVLIKLCKIQVLYNTIKLQSKVIVQNRNNTESIMKLKMNKLAYVLLGLLIFFLIDVSSTNAINFGIFINFFFNFTQLSQYVFYCQIP